MVGAKANIGTHIYPGSGHGRTSNRLCVRIVLSCTGMLVAGGLQAMGEKRQILQVPTSLIEASANIVGRK
jgi:hypothetical protein